MQIIHRSRGHDAFVDELADYAKTVDAELRMIDRLVAMCYQALGQFDKFISSTMVYFAAVSSWEQARRRKSAHAFLLADNADFIAVCQAVANRLTTDISDGDFTEFARDAIEPFNSVGLFSPTSTNMYSHTAAR